MIFEAISTKIPSSHVALSQLQLQHLPGAMRNRTHPWPGITPGKEIQRHVRAKGIQLLHRHRSKSNEKLDPKSKQPIMSADGKR